MARHTARLRTPQRSAAHLPAGPFRASDACSGRHVTPHVAMSRRTQSRRPRGGRACMRASSAPIRCSAVDASARAAAASAASALAWFAITPASSRCAWCRARASAPRPGRAPAQHRHRPCDSLSANLSKLGVRGAYRAGRAFQVLTCASAMACAAATWERSATFSSLRRCVSSECAASLRGARRASAAADAGPQPGRQAAAATRGPHHPAHTQASMFMQPYPNPTTHPISKKARARGPGAHLRCTLATSASTRAVSARCAAAAAAAAPSALRAAACCARHSSCSRAHAAACRAASSAPACVRKPPRRAARPREHGSCRRRRLPRRVLRARRLSWAIRAMPCRTSAAPERP